MNDVKLVLPKDAARILDIGYPRLYRAIRTGKITRCGPSGRYVDLDDIRAYLKRYGRYSGFKEYKKSA